jgi:hypothetical protein
MENLIIKLIPFVAIMNIVSILYFLIDEIKIDQHFE